MKQQLFGTKNDWTGLVLRLTLGVVLFPHGAQKMLGLFGGHGFNKSMSFFTDTMQLPWIIGLLVMVIEFVGTIALIAGFASRIWGFLIIVLMLGIIFTSHIDHGFFMNWYGDKQGEGFEYHLLAIGLALGIVLNGSGKASVDQLIAK